MTDFTKILDKAKELEAKMKESQEKIKEIKAEGVSGSNSVKITLDGEGEMQKIELSDEIIKEDKTIIGIVGYSFFEIDETSNPDLYVSIISVSIISGFISLISCNPSLPSLAVKIL